MTRTLPRRPPTRQPRRARSRATRRAPGQGRPTPAADARPHRERPGRHRRPDRRHGPGHHRGRPAHERRRRSPAPSSRARRPTATSPTTAASPAASPSRSGNSASPSPGSARRPPGPVRPGEVEIPAYEAMRKDGRLADRMLEILIDGVSTRRYEHVLPEMAETVGVSKSQVSRETIEAGERLLKELAERDLSGPGDPGRLDRRHPARAVPRHLRRGRGRRRAASTSWGCARGPPRTPWWPRRCWRTWSRGASIRSGGGCSSSTARRPCARRSTRSSARDQPVQRCRNHKLRNVVGHLPKDQHEQAKATLRAAFKLDAKEGMAKLEQYASWLEREWPGAAASLREGLGGDVHDQPAGAAERAAALPGDDEPDRQRPLGGPGPDASGEELAERGDGPAVDGGGLRRGLEGIPPDHGPRASLDAQGGPGRAGRDRSLVQQAAAG